MRRGVDVGGVSRSGDLAACGSSRRLPLRLEKPWHEGLILANLKESDQPAAVCILCGRGWERHYTRLIQSFDKDGLVGARASDDAVERSGAEFDGRFFGFDDLLDDGVG